MNSSKPLLSQPTQILLRLALALIAFFGVAMTTALPAQASSKWQGPYFGAESADDSYWDKCNSSHQDRRYLFSSGSSSFSVFYDDSTEGEGNYTKMATATISFSAPSSETISDFSSSASSKPTVNVSLSCDTSWVKISNDTSGSKGFSRSSATSGSCTTQPDSAGGDYVVANIALDVWVPAHYQAAKVNNFKSSINANGARYNWYDYGIDSSEWDSSGIENMTHQDTGRFVTMNLQVNLMQTGLISCLNDGSGSFYTNSSHTSTASNTNSYYRANNVSVNLLLECGKDKIAIHKSRTSSGSSFESSTEKAVACCRATSNASSLGSSSCSTSSASITVSSGYSNHRLQGIELVSKTATHGGSYPLKADTSTGEITDNSSSTSLKLCNNRSADKISVSNGSISIPSASTALLEYDCVYEDSSVTITASKKWLTSSGALTTWPSGKSCTVQLYQDGVSMGSAYNARLTSTNTTTSWAVEENHAYSIVEEQVEGFDEPVYSSNNGSTFSGDGTITVTNKEQPLTLTAAKEWVDSDGKPLESWPENVSCNVQLYMDDDPLAGYSATLSASSPTASWEVDPGHVYSVVEEQVEGYEPGAYSANNGSVFSASGTITVTNKKLPAPTYTVHYMWSKAEICSDSTAAGSYTTKSVDQALAEAGLQTLSDGSYNAWGKSVSATEPEDYGAVGPGTSTQIEGETWLWGKPAQSTDNDVDITVSKTWLDSNGSETQWPAGKTCSLQLYAEGSSLGEDFSATLSEDEPAVTWEVPAGKSYSVVEEQVEGYEPGAYSASNGSVFNASGTITVTNRQEASTPSSPDSVSIHYIWNNKPIGTVVSAAGLSHAVWDVQSSFRDEKASGFIAWTYSETDQEPATYTIDYKPGTSSLQVPGHDIWLWGKDTQNFTVTKKWSGDTKEVRPSSITVSLCNEEGPTGSTAQLSEASNWSYAWNNLPVGDYYVTEETLSPTSGPGTYTPSYDDTPTSSTITNIYDEKTDVVVKKVWDDSDNASQTRPSNVTVTLLKDGVPADIDFNPIKLTAAVNWTYKWTDLSAGNYSVKETPVDGYLSSTIVSRDTSSSTFTITNSKTETTTAFTLSKLWAGDTGPDDPHRGDVTIALAASDPAYSTTVTLTASNGWTATTELVTKTAQEEDVTYTATEAGYDTSYYDSSPSSVTLNADNTVASFTNTCTAPAGGNLTYLYNSSISTNESGVSTANLNAAAEYGQGSTDIPGSTTLLDVPSSSTGWIKIKYVSGVAYYRGVNTWESAEEVPATGGPAIVTNSGKTSFTADDVSDDGNVYVYAYKREGAEETSNTRNALYYWNGKLVASDTDTNFRYRIKTPAEVGVSWGENETADYWFITTDVLGPYTHSTKIDPTTSNLTYPKDGYYYDWNSSSNTNYTTSLRIYGFSSEDVTKKADKTEVGAGESLTYTVSGTFGNYYSQNTDSKGRYLSTTVGSASAGSSSQAFDKWVLYDTIPKELQVTSVTASIPYAKVSKWSAATIDTATISLSSPGSKTDANTGTLIWRDNYVELSLDTLIGNFDATHYFAQNITLSIETTALDGVRGAATVENTAYRDIGGKLSHACVSTPVINPIKNVSTPRGSDSGGTAVAWNGDEITYTISARFDTAGSLRASDKSFTKHTSWTIADTLPDEVELVSARANTTMYFGEDLFENLTASVTPQNATSWMSFSAYGNYTEDYGTLSFDSENQTLTFSAGDYFLSARNNHMGQKVLLTVVAKVKAQSPCSFPNLATLSIDGTSYVSSEAVVKVPPAQIRYFWKGSGESGYKLVATDSGYSIGSKSKPIYTLAQAGITTTGQDSVAWHKDSPYGSSVVLPGETIQLASNSVDLYAQEDEQDGETGSVNYYVDGEQVASFSIALDAKRGTADGALSGCVGKNLSVAHGSLDIDSVQARVSSQLAWNTSAATLSASYDQYSDTGASCIHAVPCVHLKKQWLCSRCRLNTPKGTEVEVFNSKEKCEEHIATQHTARIVSKLTGTVYYSGEGKDYATRDAAFYAASTADYDANVRQLGWQKYVYLNTAASAYCCNFCNQSVGKSSSSITSLTDEIRSHYRSHFSTVIATDLDGVTGVKGVYANVYGSTALYEEYPSESATPIGNTSTLHTQDYEHCSYDELGNATDGMDAFLTKTSHVDVDGKLATTTLLGTYGVANPTGREISSWFVDSECSNIAEDSYGASALKAGLNLYAYTKEAVPVKTVDKQSARPDDTLTYTVEAEFGTWSSKSLPYRSWQIYDEIPQGTTFVKGSATITGLPGEAGTLSYSTRNRTVSFSASSEWLKANYNATAYAGQKVTLTFQAIVDSNTRAFIKNTAYTAVGKYASSSLDPDDPNNPSPKPSPSNEVVTEIDPTPAKSVDKACALAGDELEYSIVVPFGEYGVTCNKPYRSFVLRDAIPRNTTLVEGSAALSGLPKNAGNLSCSNGEVVFKASSDWLKSNFNEESYAGQDLVLTFKVTTNEGFVGTVTNTGYCTVGRYAANPADSSNPFDPADPATPDDPEPIPSNTVATEIIDTPVKTVDKASAQPGDTLTYRISSQFGTYAEGGNGYSSWKLVDALPAGVSYLEGSATISGIPSSKVSISYDSASNTLSAEAGSAYLSAYTSSVYAGQNVVLAFKAKIEQDACGAVVNKAWLDACGLSTEPAQAKTVVVPAPVKTVDKATAKAGDVLTYSVTAKFGTWHANSEPFESWALLDELPVGITYNNDATASWSSSGPGSSGQVEYDSEARTLVYRVSPQWLALYNQQRYAGQTVELTFTATVDASAAGTIVNKAFQDIDGVLSEPAQAATSLGSTRYVMDYGSSGPDADGDGVPDGDDVTSKLQAAGLLSEVLPTGKAVSSIVTKDGCEPWGNQTNAWFLDPECLQPATADSAKEVSTLYSYNTAYITLDLSDYAKSIDIAEKGNRQLYAEPVDAENVEKAATTTLRSMIDTITEGGAKTYPTSNGNRHLYRYGATVEVPQLEDAYYLSKGGEPRTLVTRKGGWIDDPLCGSEAIHKLQVTKSITVYKDWATGIYDGIVTH